MKSELWKDIIGFEGLYQINENGQIRSIVKGIIISPYLVSKGYWMVILHKNGKRFKQYVHRLVAFHYVPNGNNYPFVNHIDGDKINNHYTNLEWCTPSQNNSHAYKNGLKSRAVTSNTRKVFNPTTGQSFNSIKELSVFLNMKYNDVVCQLIGRRINKTGFISGDKKEKRGRIRTPIGVLKNDIKRKSF